MRSPTAPAFQPDSRRANMGQLRQGNFDVLILGGGINGAGIARDLALRARSRGVPLRVALVEQRHFASGTSGKNSQLIHGGLRYLKQLEFHLVREALRERATLLRIAPHLVEPLPFLIPFYSHWSRIFYGTGLFLYDQLAGKRNIGRRHYLSRADLIRLEPDFAADHLAAAAIYFDCTVHSARLVLENVFDAVRDGAIVCNYVRAEQTTRRGDHFEVTLRDSLTGERFTTTARKLVDTTGPWQKTPSLRPVRGSHLVFPRLNASNNAVAYFAADGRIIFVIPWGARKELSLVGTTDCDHDGGPDEVRISPEEIRYLLRVLDRIFPRARRLRPITAFSSLRPLVERGSRSATKTSREHRIWNSAEGILHVAGGKYTTYRLMSEQAADVVCREVAPFLVGASTTMEAPLGGNSRSWFDREMAGATELAARYGLENVDAEYLVRHYGQLAATVLESLPAMAPDGLTRFESAILSFAVAHESAQRLADLMFVSTYWGYGRRWTAETLAPLSREMGRLLGWSEQRRQEEVSLVLDLLTIPEY